MLCGLPLCSALDGPTDGQPALGRRAGGLRFQQAIQHCLSMCLPAGRRTVRRGGCCCCCFCAPQGLALAGLSVCLQRRETGVGRTPVRLSARLSGCVGTCTYCVYVASLPLGEKAAGRLRPTDSASWN